MISFHGTGLSVAPEITFSDISASCQNPEEVCAVYMSSTCLVDVDGSCHMLLDLYIILQRKILCNFAFVICI